MPLSLASSVTAPNFDLMKTVGLAAENGFKSIQLYVDESLNNPQYVKELVQNIIDSGIKSVIIHLPNYNKMPDLLKAVKELVYSLPSSISKVGLIHYEDDIPITFSDLTTKQGNRTQPMLSLHIPKIDRFTIGVENSMTGTFNPRHVWAALKLAKANNIPFVFDIGRIMYPIVTKLGKDDKGNDIKDSYINDDIKMQIYSFIDEIINNLDPQLDILHVSGKTDWDKFRDYACALGAEGDITKPLIPSLKRFLDAGGKVVLEHEDLQQALDSRVALES